MYKKKQLQQHIAQSLTFSLFLNVNEDNIPPKFHYIFGALFVAYDDASIHLAHDNGTSI